MRRPLESRLASALLLTALGIFAGLAPWPETVVKIPPPSMEALAYLEGRTREEVHAAWGEPDGCLSGFFGDIYTVNDFSNIIIYYNSELLNEGTADIRTIPVLYVVYSET